MVNHNLRVIIRDAIFVASVDMSKTQKSFWIVIQIAIIYKVETALEIMYMYLECFYTAFSRKGHFQSPE